VHDEAEQEVSAHGAGGRAAASGPESGGDPAPRIRLFDADRTDQLLEFDAAMRTRPSERQLLWVDIEGLLSDADHHRIRDRFELDPATDAALAGRRDDRAATPDIGLHGQYFHVRLAAAPDPSRREVAWLDLVGGPNVVISRHAEPLALLEAMDERIAADTTIGELDAAEFVESVLDAVVTSYLHAVDAIEDQVDVIDAKALGRERFDDLFTELIEVRRRVGRLRRLLAAHREVFAILGRREFIQGTGAAAPEGLQAVAQRFETALAAVEATRDLVLGSFEVLMTRTAQRTNDVMRVLTVVTVLALPATIVAGFMGMNVATPLPDKEAWPFWVVVAAIAVVELAILGVIRSRRWI
jgi:magnesium transporter